MAEAPTACSGGPEPPVRPAVDIVVPFRGDDAARGRILAMLSSIALGPGDTVTLVDNGPTPPPVLGDRPRILHAPERPTSYHARNRGAAAGVAPWLVFLDADVVAPADLLDRYFATAPAADTGLLAGGIRDEELPADGRPSAVARFAARGAMAQTNTLDRPEWAYAQTANVAVRREAFAAVGGFDERPRSGGDADFCFRLRAAGFALEPRLEAEVIHCNRTTLRALLRQRARHGSGGAWLDRIYPGSFPAHPLRGSLAFTARTLAGAVRSTARGHDEAGVRLVDLASHWAYELGRRVPNEPRDRA